MEVITLKNGILYVSKSNFKKDLIKTLQVSQNLKREISICMKYSFHQKKLNIFAKTFELIKGCL